MDQPESPETPAGAGPALPGAPGSSAAPARPSISPLPARAGGPDFGRPEPGAREPFPVPARETIEAVPREPLRPIEVASRSIHANGEEWIVSEGGRTSSGRGTDSRAPLLFLLFARAADPDEPVREILSAVPGLDHLGDDELVALLVRAREYREVQQRSEVFTDTRKKGQKGL